MNENDMLKAVLSNLSDVIIVEDSKGKVHYQNHPEIDYSAFKKESKVVDEFYDEEKKRWYKLSETKFNVENRKFILKKYGHITKMKKQQTILEKDGKTGLLRSEIFKDKIDYLSRVGKDMIFVLIDIDNFKKINDNYGHDVGDDVLSKIGLLIRTIFRSSDLLGRFGGDEIILSLVDINIDMAIEKLEILRDVVTNIILNNENRSTRVTISVGCMAYDKNLTYDENFSRVDELLYVSKSNGKNQINYYKDAKIKRFI